jgi:ATP-dependent DNA helicase RecG
MEIDLDTPVQFIKGVGPKMGAKLQKLGIEKVRDLLFYFPRTYLDYTKVTKIGDIEHDAHRSFPPNGHRRVINTKAEIKNNKHKLNIKNDEIPWQARNDIKEKLTVLPAGEAGNSSKLKAVNADQLIDGSTDNYTIAGNIVGIANKRTRRRGFTVTEAVVEDGSGSIKAVWFNQPYLIKMLRAGSKVILNGKIKHDYYSGMMVMESPQRAERPKIVPIYPETAGVSSNYISKIVTRILNGTPTDFFHGKDTEGKNPEAVSCQLLAVRDYLPEEIIKKNNLMGLREAVSILHQPENIESLNKAKRRMAFDELFLIALRSQIAKAELATLTAPRIEVSKEELLGFVKSLPFKLTDDQRKASWAIIKDLAGGDTHRFFSPKGHRKERSEIVYDTHRINTKKGHRKLEGEKLKSNTQKSYGLGLKTYDYVKPMSRLLNGDVGSGKTVVAAFAAFVAFKSGFRTLIMAPTAILANQHYKTLCEILEPHGVKVGIITSDTNKLNMTHTDLIHRKDTDEKNQESRIMNQEKLTALPRRQAGNSLKPEASEADVVVGTHALLHLKEPIKNVGLVVVDEQHRFGVEQRARIRKITHTDLFHSSLPAKDTDDFSKISDNSVNKINGCHFLSMTATPIPRTMQLALFGDLDVSVIREMPKGRKPIETKFVAEKDRERTYEFIRDQIKAGRQAFVVCPLIEEEKNENPKSEIRNPKSVSPARQAYSLFDLDRKSVVKEYEKLDHEVFPNLKIGMLHGRMKAKEKDKVMTEFSAKRVDILVSTSVVEVGVDIANATIMMVEDAERFGLSQMHQFRGRVGRGEHQSYCFLFSATQSEKAKRRLETMEKVSDGFRLAEEDLAERGPGEIYGRAQSGMLDFKFADLSNMELIRQASESAKEAIEKDPRLIHHDGLKEKLSEFVEKSHME